MPTTKINGAALDRHITNYPEAPPTERAEESAEEALRDWGVYYLPTLQSMSEQVDHEMAEAYAAAGGDYGDCSGFEELKDVVRTLQAVTAPKGKVPPFNGTRKEIG